MKHVPFLTAALLTVACPTEDDATSDASGSSGEGTTEANETETEEATSGSSSSGGSSGGSSSSSGGDEVQVPPLPDNAYCDPAKDWTSWPTALEVGVLELVNERRAQGGVDCRTGGQWGPAEPLVLNGALMCAARRHSMDMNDRGFFDHTNPDGESPVDRMLKAGYDGSMMGENIAYGGATAEEVMSQWMLSDPHCANIMRPEWTELGVGYYGGLSYWTQNFGTP